MEKTDENVKFKWDISVIVFRIEAFVGIIKLNTYAHKSAQFSGS